MRNRVLQGILFLVVILPGFVFGQTAVERALALRGVSGGGEVAQYLRAEVSGNGGVTGGAKWLSYTNGTRQFEYYFFVSAVQDGTTLTVEVDNVVVDQSTVSAGQIGGSIQSPANVPTVNENSVITVKRDSQVLGTGTFRVAVIRPYTIFTSEATGSKVLPPTNSQAVATGVIFFDEASTLAEVLVIGTGFTTAPQTVSFNGPAAADQNGPAVFTFENVQSFPTDGTILFLARGFVQLTPTFRGLLNEGLLYVDVRTTQFPTGEVRGQFGLYTPPADFEGDGVTDISLFRPSEGVWYFLNSSDRRARSIRFGQAGDRIVQGDYDGDDIADLAAFRRVGDFGVWSVRCSSDGVITTTQWGLAGDIPVVADFDADGRDDLTVFRPSTGVWYIRRASDVIKPRQIQSGGSEIEFAQWGSGGDVPFAGDFDGDGRPDLTVFRPSNGVWYIRRSSDNNVVYRQWGLATDIPLVGDFDGSGRDDIAVYRPSNGTWYLLNGLDQARFQQFGLAGDIPTAGDYDGDGQTDITVFRPSNGTWYGLTSSNQQFFASRFGLSGDQPTTGR